MTAPAAPAAALRRLLEAAGYRLEDRPIGLLATRARDRRTILVIRGERSPSEAEPEFPKDQIHRTLVYDQDPGPVARELASARGIEILDPSSLGPALGELLLVGPDPRASDRALSAPQDLEPLPQIFPEGLRTIRPRLSRRDAEALSGLDGSRYALRLVPFYVAPYRVRVASAHGGPGAPTDHLVAVNAISGWAEIWEANDREFVADLEEPREQLAPSLTAEEARTVAEDAIRKKHSASVDHTEQHGGAIVIERRRVPPGPGDLRIGPAVLV
ncbi:MAG: hypothetical protein L3J93_01920, partial [Thermoplasmata archaeon]|nr:hypothetical protein [Thermoplasmata archaeon]